GHTWCGYSSFAEFAAEARRVKPTESSRVTYSSDDLVKLTYQVAPESGDWVVIDRYTVSNGEVSLRRENLLTQRNLDVIEDTTVQGGKLRPFRVVRVSTLDGRTAEAPPRLALPRVPVVSNPSEMVFMRVVAEMRSRPIASLCKRLE
ncbi:MAG: hypothetical protein ACREUG_04400, partial [Steroidobacteraceae bacterium]